jgi:acetyl-CoA C-acetyltransferase
MSGIAAVNPHAWIQKAVSADKIRNPGAGNRMVHYPYTKLMTSNISVDQGAALILMSEEAADRHGVPRHKRVFLRASTEMSHTILLSERQQLHRHPGQELAAQRVLEIAGKTPNDLDHVDLYSCFPFAVQAGAAALGIGVDPLPSLTGSMTFFGGPFGNYVLHSKAQMVERCRAQPGSTGAIGSVGGSYAHFGYGIYSTDPGECVAPAIEDVSDPFAAMSKREYLENLSGEATVETYSVEVQHTGPTRAFFAALTDDGKRVWGKSEDPVVMDALLADEDACGRRARLHEGLVDLD